MIQLNSILNVVDNSGAKYVSCINVGKGFNKKYAVIGDIILVSVKKLRNKRRITSKVFKGDICKAIIVRSKTKNKNFLHFYNIKFLENSVVLLNRQNKFLFTRIFGVLPFFFRYSKFLRIVSLSLGLVT